MPVAHRKSRTRCKPVMKSTKRKKNANSSQLNSEPKYPHKRRKQEIKDIYCYICHHPVGNEERETCAKCPRISHVKCLKKQKKSGTNGTCECERDSLGGIILPDLHEDKLKQLLTYAVRRIPKPSAFILSWPETFLIAKLIYQVDWESVVDIFTMPVDATAFIHSNGFRIRGRYQPREIVFVSLDSVISAMFLINVSPLFDLQSDAEASSNLMTQMHWHKLGWESPPSDVPSEYLASEMPDILADQWRFLNSLLEGKSSGYFVCLGETERNIFRDVMKLPVLSIHELPLWRDVPTLQQLTSHPPCADFSQGLSTHKGIHTNDNTNRCSGRIAHYYAKYLNFIKQNSASSLVWATEADLEFLTPGHSIHNPASFDGQGWKWRGSCPLTSGLHEGSE